MQSYLPTVGGSVVAGCFRRDTNPEAPSGGLPAPVGSHPRDGTVVRHIAERDSRIHQGACGRMAVHRQLSRVVIAYGAR